MSRAREFQEYIKTHPGDKQNIEVWKKFGVTNIIYTWNKQGFYKINSFDFDDESAIEKNVVYD